MKALLDRITAAEILISDGAMGTFLQSHGLQPGECPEAWCLSQPEKVAGVSRAYISAGSHIVKTNSFGASRYKLRSYGLEDNVTEINVAAAKLAAEAADGSAYVAASIGPTGHIAEDEGGDMRPDDFYNAFKVQAQGLEAGGADVVCIETMSSLVEAVQAIAAAKDGTGLPVICTFTFQKSLRGFRTMMGVLPAVAASEALEAGADIVGANCGNGVADMVEIVYQMKEGSPDALIVVHPNAGAPVMEDGHSVFKDSPDDMASQVKNLLAAGVSIVGGCCGTTPEHIRAMREAVQAAA